MRPSVGFAHRHRDRRAGVDHVDPARDPVRRVHRDRTDPVVAQMLLHLGDQHAIRAVVGRHRDLQGRVDFRQVVGESGVDDDASDLDHLADGSVQACVSSRIGNGRPRRRPTSACSLPNAFGIACDADWRPGRVCRLGRFDPAVGFADAHARGPPRHFTIARDADWRRGRLCRLARFNPVCGATSEPDPCATQQTRSGRQG